MGKKMSFDEFANFIEHDKARGGWWIRPDGNVLPVLSEAEHYDTLKKELGDQERMYVAGYRKGYTRITLCSESSFVADVPMDIVEQPAIDTLVGILRHLSKRLHEDRHKWRGVVEVFLDREEYGSYPSFETVISFTAAKDNIEDRPGAYLEVATKVAAWWTGERLRRKKQQEEAVEEQIEAMGEALELAA